MNRIYTLYFKNVVLGTVEDTGGDFPWRWGRFTPYNGNDELGTRKFIAAYIAHSQKLRAAYESRDTLLKQQLLYEGVKFYEMLDHGLWRLVNTEEEDAILPAFYSATDTGSNNIGWRFSFSSDDDDE